MRRVLMLPVAMIGTLAGCGADLSLSGAPNVVGNGVQKSEERPVGDFHKISAYGVGTLKVSRSEAPSLTVRAEENMLPYVKSEVEDGVLRIGVGAGTYTWHGYPETSVAVNALRSVEMSGQTNLSADGVDGNELDVKADGQCSVSVSGSAQSQVLVFSGQSSYSAAELKCRKTTIQCSGQCHLVVWASEELDVKADGNCTVEYVGNPTKKTIETTGAAKVVQRESQKSGAPVEDGSKKT